MKKRQVGCKQVLDFIKKEGWYTDYKEAVIEYMKAIDDPDKPLDIRMKRHLLKYLFCFNGIDAVSNNMLWDATSKGYDFWCEKNVVLRSHFRYIDLKYKTVKSK